jgi:hypothetical protein
MKSEFVYVKPKTREASEYFEHEMRFLHSCKVKERRDGKLFLASISGNHNFWVSESEDRNWKLLNNN